MTDYKLNNDGGMSVIESQQTKRFHKTCFSKQTKHIVAAATLPMMMLSPLTNSYAEEPELDFGGFIKISAAATTDGVAGFDDAAGFYNADLLFADSDQGTRFGLDARETRLHLTYRHSDTPIGPVKVYIESNFGGEGSTNGNANETYGNHQLSLVLRHAYIETNGFLIGQTFSTFSDLSIVTNILDYGGNAGMIFSRNPQIRYTHQVGDFTLKMALENASSTFDYNNVTDDQRLPDFVGRVDYDPQWGHFSISSVVRELRVENDQYEAHKITGGVAFTATKNILEDKVTLMGQYFRGTLGQYGASVGFADGMIFENDQGSMSIDPLNIHGATLGTTINWTDKFQSIVLGSWAKNLEEGHNMHMFGTGHAIEDVWSLNANMFYDLTDKFMLGFEYKKIVGNLSDQTKANVDRFQASAFYFF